MNAFDNHKKQRMPKDPIWLVKDTQTGLFLKVYSTELENCQWGVSIEAIQFPTEEAANNVITSWGEEPGQRFIGQNPPPH